MRILIADMQGVRILTLPANSKEYTVSINSWKREFYQGRLKDAAKTALGAAKHSLRKWRGLKPKNLAKHNLTNRAFGIVNIDTNATFDITAYTCALCLRARDAWSELDCNSCAYKLANGYDCGSNYDSGWHLWCDEQDPSKMIKELKKTIKFIKKNQI